MLLLALPAYKAVPLGALSLRLHTSAQASQGFLHTWCPAVMHGCCLRTGGTVLLSPSRSADKDMIIPLNFLRVNSGIEYDGLECGLFVYIWTILFALRGTGGGTRKFRRDSDKVSSTRQHDFVLPDGCMESVLASLTSNRQQ